VVITFEVEVVCEGGKLERYEKETFYEVLELFSQLSGEEVTSIVIKREGVKWRGNAKSVDSREN